MSNVYDNPGSVEGIIANRKNRKYFLLASILGFIIIIFVIVSSENKDQNQEKIIINNNTNSQNDNDKNIKIDDSDPNKRKILLQMLDPVSQEVQSHYKHDIDRTIFQKLQKPDIYEDEAKFGQIINEYTNLDDSNLQQQSQNNLYTSHTGNAFFDTFNIAFYTHGDITLSPDDVWIAISQAFAKHVNINSEQLRDVFVDFEGKKQLAAEYRPGDNPFSKGFDWQNLLNQFEDQIIDNTQGDIQSVLVSDFSTTGPIERVVSQITVMQTMEKYFTYLAYPGCGINNITLLGTQEDWLNILNRVKILKQPQYKAEFWINQLEPVIQQFYNTYNGDVDLDFWNSVIVDKELDLVCAKQLQISGWILAFYPYKSDETILLNDDYKKIQYNYEEIPDYASKVPFKLVLTNKDVYDMLFLSGFSGVQEISKNNYRPKLSAAIAFKNKNDTIPDDYKN